MLSEFYTSKRCIDFVKKLVATTSLNILDRIETRMMEGNGKSTAINLISILKSDINNQTPIVNKFKYIEIKYGVTHYDKVSVPKAAYVIDIYDILMSYLNNENIRILLDCVYSSRDENQYTSFFAIVF